MESQNDVEVSALEDLAESKDSSSQVIKGWPLPDRIVPDLEFRQIFLGGRSETAEWRLRKAGKLPPRIVIDGRAIGRRLSDCLAWLAALPTENPAE